MINGDYDDNNADGDDDVGDDVDGVVVAVVVVLVVVAIQLAESLSPIAGSQAVTNCQDKGLLKTSFAKPSLKLASHYPRRQLGR